MNTGMLFNWGFNFIFISYLFKWIIWINSIRWEFIFREIVYLRGDMRWPPSTLHLVAYVALPEHAAVTVGGTNHNIHQLVFISGFNFSNLMERLDLQFNVWTSFTRTSVPVRPLHNPERLQFSECIVGYLHTSSYKFLMYVLQAVSKILFLFFHLILRDLFLFSSSERWVICMTSSSLAAAAA